MSSWASHYRTGEEILAGDRISWAGSPGRVVFVLGSPGVATEWVPLKDWFAESYPGGFLLDVDAAGLVFHEESEEDLEFVRRKQ
jgi:hypothetical protein